MPRGPKSQNGKNDRRGLQEALRRIEECKKSRSRKLNLGAVGLIEIPTEVWDLSSLERLELFGNQITAIPEALGRLTNLQELNLSGNQITAIPEALGRLTNLQLLNLSANQITAIPEELGRLTNLQGIYLSGNQITAIPEELGRLTNLQGLLLARNQITTIPEALGRLTNLQALELGSNQITAIPEALGRLTNLLGLHLYNNQITAIPEALGRLTNLQDLYLGSNQITAIPEALGRLTNLQSLDLGGNQITAIPEALGRLTNLQRLSLGGNQITTIPEDVGRLTNLHVLYLYDNQITAIPEALGQLTYLQVLFLRGNPLPDEVLAAADRGPRSLFEYLKTAKAHPRTVKIMLLGEPESGKTTLVEALKGNPTPCDPKRPETIGVKVTILDKNHPGDGKPIYLATWDFAGQHMEHATHQFFLTENAIYLILWKSRPGADSGQRDLWYWLELLKMRVPNPTFLLVATHTRGPSVLNLTEIQAAYPGCIGQFDVELCDLTGVAALESKIVELAAASPAMNAPWPPPWLAVRDRVRGLRSTLHSVSAEEFRDLCSQEGEEDSRKQEELADQLHKLGEIVFFPERPKLARLVILNPTWASELVALVVRDPEVRKRKGKLLRGDLDRLWGELPHNVREHMELLMDEFDLTYATDHYTEIGMVVESLPPAPESVHRLDIGQGAAQMERIFRFPALQRHLPPGVPTWAFARAQRLLVKDNGPWRNAAIFEDTDTNSRAMIVANDLNREVRLRVAGDYPPYFFGQLEAILRDTFRRYPGAQPEQLIPCPCRPGCTHSYLYETVLKRVRDHKPTLTCGQSAEDVEVNTLLSGFTPQTDAGQRALEAEMRAAVLTALNERDTNKCPSVFTLVPSKGFTLLDTWTESATQGQELDLTLYCEYEKQWHATSNSVYRFRPDKEWFDQLKEKWKQLTAHTKRVAPLAGVAGAPLIATLAGAIGEAEKIVGDVSRSPMGALAGGLGERDGAAPVDLETRHLLERLIEYLDSKRPATQPHNGGLFPYHRKEDGRRLWLCAEHRTYYESGGAAP